MNKSLNLSDPSDPFIERIYTNGYSRDRIKDQIDKCFLSDPLKKGSDQIKDQSDKLSDPTSNPYISTMDRMDQMDQITNIPLENLDNSANIELNQDDSEKNQDNLNGQESSNEKTEIDENEVKRYRKGLHKEFLANNITEKESMLTFMRKQLDDPNINSFNDLLIGHCCFLINKLRGVENIIEE